MTKIYLIRHGEAEGNLYRRAQGAWNSHLTPNGWLQVDALERRFEGERIDAVYASDLSRAQETATAISRSRGLEVRVEPRIREINMGVWEGKPWGELEHGWPEEMRLFYTDPAAWHVQGSERFEDVQARMLSALREMGLRHPGQTVAAVSHGMAIKCFIYAALGIDPRDPEAAKLHADNTAVTTMTVDDGGVITVESYFDNSHLGELSTLARQVWWRKAGSFDSSCFYYVPLDLRDRANADTYIRCYSDSWLAAHGDTRGFVPGAYVSTARSHSAMSPECLVKVMSGDELAGVIELDPRRGREDGKGWISLLYLTPEFRGRGMGVQLLGYAFYYFQAQGRDSVRLHAAVTNQTAIRFYHRYEFRDVRVDSGVSSDQLLMERGL